MSVSLPVIERNAEDSEADTFLQLGHLLQARLGHQPTLEECLCEAGDVGWGRNDGSRTQGNGGVRLVLTHPFSE